jgi:hypothetical protein
MITPDQGEFERESALFQLQNELNIREAMRLKDMRLEYL